MENGSLGTPSKSVFFPQTRADSTLGKKPTPHHKSSESKKGTRVSGVVSRVSVQTFAVRTCGTDQFTNEPSNWCESSWTEWGVPPPLRMRHGKATKQRYDKSLEPRTYGRKSNGAMSWQWRGREKNLKAEAGTVRGWKVEVGDERQPCALR